MHLQLTLVIFSDFAIFVFLYSQQVIAHLLFVYTVVICVYVQSHDPYSVRTCVLTFFFFHCYCTIVVRLFESLVSFRFVVFLVQATIGRSQRRGVHAV